MDNNDWIIIIVNDIYIYILYINWTIHDNQNPFHPEIETWWNTDEGRQSGEEVRCWTGTACCKWTFVEWQTCCNRISSMSVCKKSDGEVASNGSVLMTGMQPRLCLAWIIAAFYFAFVISKVGVFILMHWLILFSHHLKRFQYSGVDIHDRWIHWIGT